MSSCSSSSSESATSSSLEHQQSLPTTSALNPSRIHGTLEFRVALEQLMRIQYDTEDRYNPPPEYATASSSRSALVRNVEEEETLPAYTPPSRNQDTVFHHSGNTRPRSTLAVDEDNGAEHPAAWRVRLQGSPWNNNQNIVAPIASSSFSFSFSSSSATPSTPTLEYMDELVDLALFGERYQCTPIGSLGTRLTNEDRRRKVVEYVKTIRGMADDMFEQHITQLHTKPWPLAVTR